MIKDPDSDSWDEATRLLSDRPKDVYLIRYRIDDVDRFGVYAATQERHTWSVFVGTFSDRADDIGADEPGVRKAFVSWAEHGQGLSSVLASELAATGFAEERRYLLRGFAHNVLAIALVVLLVYSLAWIPRAPAYLARSRSQRRLARGQCPHCSYSIAGLKENFCPECGMGWNLTAEDDVPQEGAP